jgi:alkanesulfonate monooxygenase SsuD/methylene tetrahydromethanopterin reductase-like flavin-dependent oxidoreductase (luciferase family)
MAMSTKEILVNAFTCGAASQAWAGLWSHPRSTEADYNTIEYWTKLARTCEESLLDGIFLADSIGVADVYQGSPAAKIRSGSFVPNIDPMMVIPVIAAVTKHLSFGVTGNTTYETPYLLARRLSTLDHLTRGRLAWNVVTGTNEAASRAVGLKVGRPTTNAIRRHTNLWRWSTSSGKTAGRTTPCGETRARACSANQPVFARSPTKVRTITAMG